MRRYKIKMWKGVPTRFKKAIGYYKYQDRYNDYMNIYVFDDEEEMYDVSEKLEKTKSDRDFAAKCFCLDKILIEEISGNIRISPFCGNIYFTIDHMGAGTISHEAFHATLGYFLRKIEEAKMLTYDPYSDLNQLTIDLEELFAYMHGSIVNQISGIYWLFAEKTTKDIDTNQNK